MTLKKWMRENGLNQAALADRLGVTASNVSLWISKKRIPNRDGALRIEQLTKGAVSVESWGMPDLPRIEPSAEEKLATLRESVETKLSPEAAKMVLSAIDGDK